MLWGKAAGRCEFAGCNKPLWKSSVTQEQVNIDQKAHIYSFSDDGPRGNEDISKEKLNDLANLMLVCHECHKKMDKEKDGGRYTVPLLQAWKADHERRIEIVTGIAPGKRSHILLYGANIGDHTSPLKFADTALALFPKRYPADDKPIELGTVNSSFLDRNPRFWSVESESLTTKFNQRVRERLASGDVSHLSVFALAPQPLLILLGSLMTDIPRADMFQLHREPQGWNWPEKPKVPQFSVQEPSASTGSPALVLALSATITDDRITSVLGDDVAIWKVTVPSPYNDFLKSPEQLTSFRALLRPLLDKIKARHGQKITLHIFPAAPVSIAVELGRVRMPKADMPWTIYDQVNALGGFVAALNISGGEKI
jgi:hypothetical protein